MSLLAAEDWHFPWLAGEIATPPACELTLPPGGVASRAVVDILQRVHQALSVGHGFGQYLIVHGGEVGGLCGYKHVPREGEVEVGYGVAPARQGLGLATAAVAALIERARCDGALNALRAETLPSNAGSNRVLERNAFEQVGERDDPEHHRILLWRRVLRD